MVLTLGITLGFLAGLFVGLIVWHRSRVSTGDEREALKLRLAALEKEREVLGEKIAWTEAAEKRMNDAFGALAGKALRENMEALKSQAKGDLEGVLKPLKENLTSLDKHVRELEQSRQGAYAGLTQKLTDLGEAYARLQETTTTLSEALRSPTVRGRWGELELRRVVEMAGMTKNVSFEEQTHTDGGRPDMTINLPGQGVLPVDSKVPLDAYLDAMESSEESVRSEHLERHARAMRARIKELGQKKYWEQFDNMPDFVVMFVPNEACLGAAFEKDPTLLEYAIEQKVLISSPVNLLALLKTVAYGWQQNRMTENVLKIAEEGRELYARIGKFIEHFAAVGKNLAKSVRAYNDASGSLDRRLIPAAERFRELGVSEEKLAAPEEIDVRPTPTSLPTPGSLFDGRGREQDERT